MLLVHILVLVSNYSTLLAALSRTVVLRNEGFEIVMLMIICRSAFVAFCMVPL